MLRLISSHKCLATTNVWTLANGNGTLISIEEEEHLEEDRRRSEMKGLEACLHLK